MVNIESESEVEKNASSKRAISRWFYQRISDLIVKFINSHLNDYNLT